MITIYLDLDGTILDVSGKYWHLHKSIMQLLDGPSLDIESYWQLRRQGLGIADIWKGSPKSQLKHYETLWLSQIEEPAYLRYDRLQPMAAATLGRLATRCRLVLTTMRHNPTTLLSQLESLELLPFFESWLCRGDLSEASSARENLIRRDSKFDKRKSIVVGDTESEITAGRRLNIPSVAVASGIRSRELLASLQPTFLVDSMADLPALLEEEARLPDAEYDSTRSRPAGSRHYSRR